MGQSHIFCLNFKLEKFDFDLKSLFLNLNSSLSTSLVTCVFSGQNPDMEEIEEMVDEADEDGSGSINFPEFVGLMLKKQTGGTTRDEIKQVPMYFLIIIS